MFYLPRPSLSITSSLRDFSNFGERLQMVGWEGSFIVDIFKKHFRLDLCDSKTSNTAVFAGKLPQQLTEYASLKKEIAFELNRLRAHSLHSDIAWMLTPKVVFEILPPWDFLTSPPLTPEIHLFLSNIVLALNMEAKEKVVEAALTTSYSGVLKTLTEKGYLKYPVVLEPWGVQRSIVKDQEILFFFNKENSHVAYLNASGWKDVEKTLPL